MSLVVCVRRSPTSKAGTRCESVELLGTACMIGNDPHHEYECCSGMISPVRDRVLGQLSLTKACTLRRAWTPGDPVWFYRCCWMRRLNLWRHIEPLRAPMFKSRNWSLAIYLPRLLFPTISAILMVGVIAFELALHDIRPGRVYADVRVLLDLHLGNSFLGRPHTSMCTYSETKPIQASCRYH